MKPDNQVKGWICNTHPNIAWDTPGTCPICRAILEPGGIFLEQKSETQKAEGHNRRRFMKIAFGVTSAFVSYLWSQSICQGFSKDSGSSIINYAGMMGRGGRAGMMGGRIWVPETLPTPRSGNWIRNLQEILSLERLSLVQYQTDGDRFRVHRPYMMIIPQEENHIQWITELFAAYNLSAAGPTPAIERSQTLAQAYEIALGLEADLMPRYDWLIVNAEDNDTRRVLSSILFQTRMHYRMFSMSLRMFGMMGGMRGLR